MTLPNFNLMKIENQIRQYVLENINELANSYSWRINHNYLPNGIKLIENESVYIQNITLKNELNRLWVQSEDQQSRKQLISYYIVDWGGIKSNKPNTLDVYGTLDAEYLINRGLQGIASWSKALVVHNPEKYAIFDARVSFSINCIQYLSEQDEQIFFPKLGSRNKRIVLGANHIWQHAKEKRWKRLNSKEVYNKYLEIIHNVASELNTSISSIEMLLFADAEKLSEKLPSSK